MNDDLSTLTLAQLNARFDGLVQMAEIGTIEALQSARDGIAPIIAEIRSRLEHGVRVDMPEA